MAGRRDNNVLGIAVFAGTALGVLAIGGAVLLMILTGAAAVALVVLLVAAVIAGIALWLLPIHLARRRGAPNYGTIVVVTLLLGWTFVGWVTALALALADPRPRQP